MLARVAMHNPSIFRPEGLLSLDEIIKDYLGYAIAYDACPQNAKYVIQQMMGSLQTDTEQGQQMLQVRIELEYVASRFWNLW